MLPETLLKKNTAKSETAKFCQISFQSYGVKIGVRAESDDLLSTVKNDLDKINPQGFEIIENWQAEHLFEIKSKGNNIFELTKGDELLWSQEGDFFSYLQSQIRLAVAEFAESRVFLHAGAVGWKGKAILIPARSFSGKSSLVAALVGQGALYYSDDFAVLDENGMLHPFHRPLSLRGIEDKYKQVDFPIEALGGKVGNESLPVGLIVLTEYREGERNPKIWKPDVLSGGGGIMEIIAHTIPIRYNPKFSLGVLNKVAECAIICKSLRGDAKEFARLLLDFFESKL